MHAQAIQHCSCPSCYSLGGCGAIKSHLSFCLMRKIRLTVGFQIHRKRRKMIRRKASLEEKKETDKVLSSLIFLLFITIAPMTPITAMLWAFISSGTQKVSQLQLSALEMSSGCFNLDWAGKEPGNGEAEHVFKLWDYPKRNERELLFPISWNFLAMGLDVWS